ncbi:BrnT family toxin [Metallococcus carri]|uniref:hypothetical protein n=1 Tax=Metallococcus carri TaxID=1656884 RepID=UPI001A9ED29C|nr:hypothetical protein [Metallococcus carri]
MQVRASALKHGVDPADISHAWANAIRLVEYEYDGEERLLVIGRTEEGDYSSWSLCRSMILRASFTRPHCVLASTHF